MKITNLNQLMKKIEDVRKAQKEYSTYTEKQVDKIFKQAAMAANKERISLAKMAVEETGMGLLEDKVIKNHFASEYIYNKYKNEKTCGVIEKDETFGLIKMAEPVGVIGAIVPTTNPTATAIYKALLALKTRNGIIFSPHPRAKKSTIEAAKVVLEAAVNAGAPKDIIAWVDEPTLELSKTIMSESDLVLATGGPGMVKSAYSSGKPAIGVGPGNAPAILDETCNIKMAVSSVLMSKTFDNGMVCATEQSVIISSKIYDKVRKEFLLRGAYILNKEEKDKIRKILLINNNKSVNPKIVGQSPYKIAEMAGFKVPESAKVLIGEVESVELEEPFSHEKLSTILGMYKADNFEDALKKACRFVELGGFGHTSSLFADRVIAKDKIDKFITTMKTSRTIINMPCSQGAIGDIYNFKLAPGLTLGCGTWGGNSVSENVGPKHLLNIKNVAERRENMLWFKVPQKVYFKYGCLPVALKDLKGKKKAFIVAGKVLTSLGYIDKIVKVLENDGVSCKLFSDVEPDPTLRVAKKGAEEMKRFEPDVIIAVGGGSSMDAAKIMWVLYEHPELKFEDLAMRFMDIRKRIYTFPHMGDKATMVCVATSAGTGSEVTPFAVITDEKTGMKYPLADYELTPNMAIIDPELMMNMPKALTASTGIDALTHAIESYVSVMASDYTEGLSLKAIKLIFEYLPRVYNHGKTDVEAREKMANASTIAGLAFANAFLGVCHSMAHKLGAVHHISHGIANALLINETIKFNSSDNPSKQASFPQYKYPSAKSRYAKIADYLNLGGKDDDEKVKLLIKAIDQLKDKVNLPKTIEEAGVKEHDFYETLDAMSEQAFDDQCTGANPRYPLISEIKNMYINVYSNNKKESIK
ncbi:bifunctional acetaldehyde-CoA/alcohol dehydrogenase [Clostridium oceanicum]|uniref:Aldehyde-alcohol dehydrogenase n=1 Tax=Clostridium oceanicum TaxID=1543 RepID=A0ABP3V1W7_9CLOT